MVAGLKFLSKKAFNPANLSNQKTVWEARQNKEKEVKRTKDREAQLKRERDDEQLARAREGDRGGNQASLRFMYAPPPGMSAPISGKNGSADQNNADQSDRIMHFKERQPGDDDAAAEFRRMLAASTDMDVSKQEELDSATVVGQGEPLSGAALSGTTIEAAPICGKGSKDNRTALEKAVGRRDASDSLTLEEQISRFPQLKNAPMAKGMNATNVGVTFKPLGTQLRNVRCLACGVWGHSRGDRECEKSGWNPFASADLGPRVAVPLKTSIRPSENQVSSQEARTNERRRKRDRFSSDNSSCVDSEESYRRRKRSRRLKRNSRDSSRRRRRSRSRSPDDRRKRSNKKESRKKCEKPTRSRREGEGL